MDELSNYQLENGQLLKYVKKGNSERTLIYFCGLMGVIKETHDFVNELSKHFTVYAFEYHNLHSGQRPISAKKFARYVNEFVCSLQLTDFAIAGYSLGTNVAYHFKRYYPVSSLFFINPAFATIKNQWLIVSRYLRTLVIVGFSKYKSIYRYLKYADKDIFTQDNDLAHSIASQFISKGFTRLLALATFSQINPILSRNIRFPNAVVIIGEKDQIMSRNQLSKLVSEFAYVLSTERGHFNLFQDPKSISRTINDALTNQLT